MTRQETQDTGFCRTCADRGGCAKLCKSLKTHLQYHFRATKSVGARRVTSYGDMQALEDAIHDGNNPG